MNDHINNKKTILTLLPNSRFKNISQLIDFHRNKYSKTYFYKPIGIEIEVTNSCNLRCLGCPIIFDQAPIPPDLLDADRIIKILRDCSKKGIFAYSLTGGEAFLRFDAVRKIIGVNSLDVYKLNTNGSFFSSIEITKKYLMDLKKVGFDKKNKYIKSVLVVSIGQQNCAGVPLQNAVNVTSLFYKIFDSERVAFSLNITDKNPLLAKKIYKDFRNLYKKATKEEFSEKLFVVRFFSLNNISTLKRLRISLGSKISIYDLLKKYKNDYLSKGCFNIRFKNNKDSQRAETLIPRCLLKPNGDLYACPGFNFVHNIGNVLSESFEDILERANKNMLLKTIFKNNLEGLFKLAVKISPKIKNLKLEKSYGPCDVCSVLTSTLKAKPTLI